MAQANVNVYPFYGRYFLESSTFYFLSKFNKIHEELSRVKMASFCKSVHIFLKVLFLKKIFDRFLY